jgi:cytidine deaminase
LYIEKAYLWLLNCYLINVILNLLWGDFMCNREELIEMAKSALKNSYSPYSKFKVGCALLTKDGKVFTGTNIENSSFGLTICAERVAVFNAVSQGYTNFEAIAIVNDKGTLCPPCGACRQVLSEFCDKTFVVLLQNNNATMAYTLNDILPLAFNLGD